MQKLRQLLELGPALYFSLVAFYCIIIYLLENNGSSEAIWVIFINFSAELRHVLYFSEALFSLDLLQNMILFVFLGFVGFLGTYKQHRVFRFFYFHSAFLFVLFAFLDDLVPRTSPVTSNSEAILGSWSLQQFVELVGIVGNADLVTVFLLIYVLMSCVSWHMTELKRLSSRRAVTR